MVKRLRTTPYLVAVERGCPCFRAVGPTAASAEATWNHEKKTITRSSPPTTRGLAGLLNSPPPDLNKPEQVQPLVQSRAAVSSSPPNFGMSFSSSHLSAAVSSSYLLLVVSTEYSVCPILLSVWALSYKSD